MYIKSSVKLIYEGQGQASNGSPTILTLTQETRCDEMETFAVNYYNEQQRNMRLSRNLVIPTYLADDIIYNNIRYELMYAEYDGRKYKVKNILKKRDTRMQMILDLQEVR